MDSPDQPRRVTLELDDDPDAFHGTLEHADGTREPFWGWLDLMSALEPATKEPQRRRPPGQVEFLRRHHLSEDPDRLGL